MARASGLLLEFLFCAETSAHAMKRNRTGRILIGIRFGSELFRFAPISITIEHDYVKHWLPAFFNRINQPFGFQGQEVLLDPGMFFASQATF